MLQYFSGGRPTRYRINNTRSRARYMQYSSVLCAGRIKSNLSGQYANNFSMEIMWLVWFSINLWPHQSELNGIHWGGSHEISTSRLKLCCYCYMQMDLMLGNGCSCVSVFYILYLLYICSVHVKLVFYIPQRAKRPTCTHTIGSEL